MSPTSTKRAAIENSTAACETAPNAVETRSEFRYRIEAASPQLIQAGRPRPVIYTFCIALLKPRDRGILLVRLISSTYLTLRPQPRPSRTTEPVNPTSPMARQRHGPRERARPRVHQHAPPRADSIKNAAAGRLRDKNEVACGLENPENTTPKCKHQKNAAATTAPSRHELPSRLSRARKPSTKSPKATKSTPRKSRSGKKRCSTM
jgi:hypothetical protein